jgi:hypothetical protein
MNSLLLTLLVSDIPKGRCHGRIIIRVKALSIDKKNFLHPFLYALPFRLHRPDPDLIDDRSRYCNETDSILFNVHRHPLSRQSDGLSLP